MESIGKTGILPLIAVSQTKQSRVREAIKSIPAAVAGDKQTTKRGDRQHRPITPIKEERPVSGRSSFAEEGESSQPSQISHQLFKA